MKSCISSLNIELRVSFRAMVLNTTLNNISVISWRSILVIEHKEVPGHVGIHENEDSQIPARSIILNISTIQSIFNIPLECVHMCLLKYFRLIDKDPEVQS